MQTIRFTAEHQIFRDTLRAFIRKEIIPYIDEWEKRGEIDRSIWKKMGDMGLMGLNYPEVYGGVDLDFYYSLVLCEELSYCFSGGFTISALVIQYMSAPYLLKYGSDELKTRYLKPVIAGDMISAVAITEPGAGSDVKHIKTTAVRDGDFYIVNGSKTFITNGFYGDFFITAVKTDPNQGTKGISLLIIDKNTPGVSTNKINKLGWHASDTAELGFNNVRVPIVHLVGKEGEGFRYLMDGLQLERLTAAIHSIATADSALQYTLEYIAQREAFGKKFRNSKPSDIALHKWLQISPRLKPLFIIAVIFKTKMSTRYRNALLLNCKRANSRYKWSINASNYLVVMVLPKTIK
jgi:Acyl-CoA dehydrogenases